MKRICQRLQRILADRGPTALRDDAAAQEHLAECAECFAVLEGLAELGAALGELPSYDAPDDVVESLLARPELLDTASAEGSPPPPFAALRSLLRRSLPGLPRLPRVRWQWAAAAAATATTVAVLGLWNLSWHRNMAPESEGHVQITVPASSIEGQEELSDEELEKLRALGYLGGVAAVDDQAEANRSVSARPPPPPPPQAPPPPPARQVDKKDKLRSDSDVTALGERENLADADRFEIIEEAITVTSEIPELDSRKGTTGTTFTPTKEGESVPTARDPWAPGVDWNLATRRGGNKQRRSSRFTSPADVDESGSSPTYYSFEDVQEMEEGQDMKPEVLSRQRAQDFLRRRSEIEGLRFQLPTGYWSNTYVPGDPAFRHLQARLLRRDRGVLQSRVESELRLHDAARQTTQPFDPPANAALAVYLHADRRRIRGETRLLVQVGLQGTERHSGRRAAMNVSLVLDAGGEIAAPTAATLRALVLAFGQAREPGDRFRLVVAGRPGGLVVGPEDFRHGPLTVALERLFVDGEEATGATLELADALRTAVTEASRSDDPASPLGSSAVMLLTSRSLGAGTETLRQLAHTAAVAGVPVSVAGVGDAVRLDELDTIALAGQGHRRLIVEPREAADLVARELTAVSRVIARAVRLRIRLAPGVRLVDVLGSRRLDTVSAEEVREAERRIDQRLMRNLGIEADRADDEDGIQIVIPSFYSGDAHVVVLDVVASGPGKIADVRVRYKDLVYLENGQARAQLSVRRGDPESESVGPLERNVLKYLLAVRLRDVLEQAGDAIARGDGASASHRLRSFRQLLEGLAAEVRGFETDADLERDVAMLGEYVELLDGARRADELLYLGESLRYAGLLKVLPRPVPAQGER